MISRIIQRCCYVVCKHSTCDLQVSRLLSSSVSQKKWRKIPVSQELTQPARYFSLTTKVRQRETVIPGRLIQSHLPDIDIPDDIPFHQIIFNACDQHKDKPALSDFPNGKSYSYNQVKENSMHVASALSRRGYKKGDVILAFSTNHVDYTVLMLAASCLGVWFSAANPTFTAVELANQISHSGCKAVFTTEAFTSTVEKALECEGVTQDKKDMFVFGDAPGWQSFQTLLDDDGKGFPDVEIRPKEDVYVLPYSSGTTGLPKGVMLTHYNLVANIMQLDKSLPVSPEENLLGLLPFYHIYGMVVIQFGALYKGAHLHVLPKFKPASFMECMRERKITRAHVAPPVVLFMTKHQDAIKKDVINLKYVISGAAPLGKEISMEFLNKFDHGVELKQIYGLTECSPVTHLDAGNNYGSIGNLVPNTLAKIIDTRTGENLAPNVEGELCVKGPQIMKGYFKNLPATKEMVTDDGWLYTGDIGYYNKEGHVYISDRLKELIKYKGSQVPPAELESVLISHPDVADACVVGVPDERAGELPKAFVVKAADSCVTEEEIIKFIEEQVTQTKWLRGGVEFIDQIPKNASGKILRKLLRNK